MEVSSSALIWFTFLVFLFSFFSGMIFAMIVNFITKLAEGGKN